jgi:hypothetical protein
MNDRETLHFRLVVRKGRTSQLPAKFEILNLCLSNVKLLGDS